MSHPTHTGHQQAVHRDVLPRRRAGKGWVWAGGEQRDNGNMASPSKLARSITSRSIACVLDPQWEWHFPVWSPPQNSGPPAHDVKSGSAVYACDKHPTAPAWWALHERTEQYASTCKGHQKQENWEKLSQPRETERDWWLNAIRYPVTEENTGQGERNRNSAGI